MISLHLDIWSSNEFTSWFFSFNYLWRKRIWLSKWLINLCEWFSSVFAILICNSSFLKLITFCKKDFFRDLNSSVIRDFKFLKQFATFKLFSIWFCWFFLLNLVGRDRHYWFSAVFSLTELLFEKLLKVSLVAVLLSMESFTNSNTSFLPHLFFFLFSVSTDAMMSIQFHHFLL